MYNKISKLIFDNIDLDADNTSKFIALANLLFENTDVAECNVLYFSSSNDKFKEIICRKGKGVQMNYYEHDDTAIKPFIFRTLDFERIADNEFRYNVRQDMDGCRCKEDCKFDLNGTCMFAKTFANFTLKTREPISDNSLDELNFIIEFSSKYIFQSNLNKKIIEQNNKILHLEREIELSKSIRDELSKEGNLQSSITKFCKLLKDHLDLSKAEICLYKEDSVPIRIGIGFAKDKMDLLNKAGILSRAMRKIRKNPKPYYVKDTSKGDNKNISRLNDVKSYINYPLIYENKVIGHIHVARSFAQRPLSEHSLYLVGVMASAAVRAFRNSMYLEKIENFNSTLRDEVDKATKDLQEANDRLKKLDELKSDFVNVVSHELRTPLTSIKGYINLLFMYGVEKLDGQQVDFLQIIKDEADRLGRLVNDMLDMNKIEAGNLTINKRQISQTELVQHLNTLNYLLDMKQIELVKDMNFSTICVDPDRFYQILTNLITNGIKFSNPGARIKFRIGDIDLNNNDYFEKINPFFEAKFQGDDESRLNWSGINSFNDFLELHDKSDSQISYEYFLKKELRDHFIVSVKDFGIGIDANNIPLLFNKFCQISTTVRDAVGGTGLGLVISRHLVNLHGGEIFVSSTKGKSTEFFFLIPKGKNVNEVCTSELIN